jgi:hypothetical protein
MRKALVGAAAPNPAILRIQIASFAVNAARSANAEGVFFLAANVKPMVEGAKESKMDRNESLLHVKAQLARYLEMTGRSASGHFRCVNPSHCDASPSMVYDRRRNKVHCFGCGVDYDIVDVISCDYGLSAGEAIKKARELFLPGWVASAGSFPMFGKPPHSHGDSAIGAAEPPDPAALQVCSKYLDLCRKRIHLTDYMAKRGIGDGVVAKRGIGYDPSFAASGDCWRAVVIPTGPCSYIARNTSGLAGEGQRYRKRGGSPVYNAEALLTADGSIVVVEGEIDALSVMEIGFEAVALGSAANASRFMEAASRMKACAPRHCSLVLALDNDDAGRAATESLSGGLSAMGIPHARRNLYGSCKDANDALLSDRVAFASRVGRCVEEAKQIVHC